MVNRAKLRGKPLDEDCKKAYTSTHEYGPQDDRVFCYGLIDCMSDEVLPKCVECKAFAINAEPLNGGDE